MQERSLSLLDDKESLVEAFGILSWEDCVWEGNWKVGPSSFNNTNTSVVPYLPAPVPSMLPLASAYATIVTNKDAILSSTNLPPVVKSVVTLCSTTIHNMAAAFHQHTQTLAREQHSPISAIKAAVSAASGPTSINVATLDSGTTHHLLTYYKAFILYHRVYNQYVTLVDDSKIRISGKGTIAI